MKQDSIARPVRVGMISLGCAKNLVDAEVMVGTLLKDGVEITSDTAQADVVIVNTCSFIDSAQQESVDTILESAELREAKNRGQGLIVSGCLPQRFRDQLPALLPEVDAFMGIDQVTQVTDIVTQALARRAERLHGSLKSKVQSPSTGIVGRLNELDRATGAPKIDELREAGKIAKAKTVLASSTQHATRHTPIPFSPLVSVNLPPHPLPAHPPPRL